jgi:TetR/AcrR family transcriptional regulator, transcriptional repressor for nem operon
VTQPGDAPRSRQQRRKERTRAALVHAAQALLAAGKTDVPIAEITQAADVGTGSFYNHFESKEALALEVTRRYAASYELDQLHEAGDQPLQRLREHFEATIELTVDRGVELGCLLGNFSTELAVHSPAIREYVAASFAAWSGAVTAALEQAQAAGELDATIDAGALGPYLVNAYEGAVARAKVTGEREPLDAFVRTSFDVLLPS